MAKSIVILGVDWKYTDAISSLVATKLDRMFLSMKDLLVYEMQGLIGDISNIDNDYINKRMSQIKIESLEYVDSVISIDINNINDDEFEKELKKLPKIYVQKKNLEDNFLTVYNDRDSLLKNLADFVVEDSDMDSQVEKIIEIVNNNMFNN